MKKKYVQILLCLEEWNGEDSETWKLSESEENVLKGLVTRSKKDRANGYTAYEVRLTDRSVADILIEMLNALREKEGGEANWFLGDEEEEYVYVD